MKNLSETGKWILGILTFAHLLGGLLLILLFVFRHLPEFIVLTETDDVNLVEVLSLLSGLITGAILVTLLGTGLMIYYIFHAALNKRYTAIIKVLWVIFFLTCGAIPQVIYFFIDIVPDHGDEAKVTLVGDEKA